jgi:hypothetical protein
MKMKKLFAAGIATITFGCDDASAKTPANDTDKGNHKISATRQINTPDTSIKDEEVRATITMGDGTTRETKLTLPITGEYGIFPKCVKGTAVEPHATTRDQSYCKSAFDLAATQDNALKGYEATYNKTNNDLEIVHKATQKANEETYDAALKKNSKIDDYAKKSNADTQAWKVMLATDSAAWKSLNANRLTAWKIMESGKLDAYRTYTKDLAEVQKNYISGGFTLTIN